MPTISGRGAPPALSISGTLSDLPAPTEGRAVALARQKPKAYSYIRFSSPEQAKGDSLRRQTEAAAKWAAEKGIELDRSLSLKDLGVSAFRGSHRKPGTALSKFLEAVQTGRVPPGSYLLIENLDRLSREDIETALGLLLTLMGAGIVVVSLMDGQEYRKGGNPAALYVALGGFIRGNEESATKSRRVKASWTARRKALYEQSGPGAVVKGQRVPWYLRVHPTTRKVSVDPVRGKIARTIALAYIAGDALREIQRDLNQKGIEPPAARWKNGSKGWSRVQITRTLRALAARDGPSPLDAAQRRRLKAALARRHRAGGIESRTGETSVLRGLGRCGYCGEPLVYAVVPKTLSGGKTETYRYLRCLTNSQFPGRCKGPPHIRYEPIAQAVVELALGIARTPPPVSKAAGRAYQTASKESEALLARAETLAAALEEAPSKLGAERLRDAWTAYQTAQSRTDRAWDEARPGMGTAEAEAILEASDDASMNKALRAVLDGIDVRHDRKTRKGVLTARLRGGGTSSVRYEAAPRVRADRGRTRKGVDAGPQGRSLRRRPEGV